MVTGHWICLTALRALQNGQRPLVNLKLTFDSTEELNRAEKKYFIDNKLYSYFYKTRKIITSEIQTVGID